MSVNEIKDFISENYHKGIGFSTKNSYYSMKRLKKKNLLLLSNKLVEKLTDPQNAKEHYQSFLRKKNIKSVKKSKIITYQTKNPNIFDINSVIIEHSKNLHKLSETIRKDEKVGSNNSLYSDTKISEHFLNKKKCKSSKTRR